jgi:hypothetical protein
LKAWTEQKIWLTGTSFFLIVFVLAHCLCFAFSCKVKLFLGLKIAGSLSETIPSGFVGLQLANSRSWDVSIIVWANSLLKKISFPLYIHLTGSVSLENSNMLAYRILYVMLCYVMLCCVVMWWYVMWACVYVHARACRSIRTEPGPLQLQDIVEMRENSKKVQKELPVSGRKTWRNVPKSRWRSYLKKYEVIEMPMNSEKWDWKRNVEFGYTL